MKDTKAISRALRCPEVFSIRKHLLETSTSGIVRQISDINDRINMISIQVPGKYSIERNSLMQKIKFCNDVLDDILKTTGHIKGICECGFDDGDDPDILVESLRFLDYEAAYAEKLQQSRTKYCSKLSRLNSLISEDIVKSTESLVATKDVLEEKLKTTEQCATVVAVALAFKRDRDEYAQLYYDIRHSDIPSDNLLNGFLSTFGIAIDFEYLDYVAYGKITEDKFQDANGNPIPSEDILKGVCIDHSARVVKVDEYGYDYMYSITRDYYRDICYSLDRACAETAIDAGRYFKGTRV